MSNITHLNRGNNSLFCVFYALEVFENALERLAYNPSAFDGVN